MHLHAHGLWRRRALNGRLGQRAAVWLQIKVRDRGLGLQLRLYAGCACDNSATEAAYAAIVVLRK